jgi:hypothetical protein
MRDRRIVFHTISVKKGFSYTFFKLIENEKTLSLFEVFIMFLSVDRIFYSIFLQLIYRCRGSKKYKNLFVTYSKVIFFSIVCVVSLIKFK